jgi:hypothetical protein
MKEKKRCKDCKINKEGWAQPVICDLCRAVYDVVGIPRPIKTLFRN